MIEIKDRSSEILNRNMPLFKILFGDNNIQKFVLGRNPNADSVLFALKDKLTGVIDDFYDQPEYKGFRVFRTKDIPADSLVVVASIANRPLTAINNLKDRNIKYILDYFALCLYRQDLFRMVDFWSDNRNDISRNFNKYEWLYDLLQDEESKIQLKKLLEFRFNFDIDVMDGFKFKPMSQYFDEKFVVLGENEVFVDGGGYCGESSQEFIRLCPGYKHIYFFEPSEKQLATAQKTLKGEKITFFPNALYSSSQTLWFDTENDTANKLDSSGNQKVDTAVLDDVINEKVTFIKMDIEGAETEALKGAEKLIRNSKPKLAICVYHNQSDYWKVPEIILSYCRDYKVYLRHYTEGVLETVMYFV